MLVVCSGKGSGENEMVVMGNVFRKAGGGCDVLRILDSITVHRFHVVETVFMLLTLCSCC